MRLYLRLGVLLGCFWLLAACGAAIAPAATTTPAPVGTIKVITTMSVLADMVRNVGGERVTVSNIIPLGAGPEDYQPTPQDAQAIAAADIVFFNGHGLEDWLTDLFRSAAKPNQPQISVSDGLNGINPDDEFRQGNPHFWLSAANGIHYVERIRDGLSQVDPAGAATYAANAAAYSQQLRELNEELKQQAQTLPEDARKLVTNHDAFPYFAQEYGFTIVGNILGNPEAEASAGELARLVRNIQAEHVRAIFSENQFSARLSQTLASEAGVAVVADLYTDSLGQPGSDVNSYIDLLRYDMQTIVTALK